MNDNHRHHHHSPCLRRPPTPPGLALHRARAPPPQAWQAKAGSSAAADVDPTTDVVKPRDVDAVVAAAAADAAGPAAPAVSVPRPASTSAWALQEPDFKSGLVGRQRGAWGGGWGAGAAGAGGQGRPGGTTRKGVCVGTRWRWCW